LAGLPIQLASLGKASLAIVAEWFSLSGVANGNTGSAGNKVASKATKHCIYCPARQSKPWGAREIQTSPQLL